MKLKCLLGIHEYESTWEEDIFRCIHCSIIKQRRYFLGLRLGTFFR